MAVAFRAYRRLPSAPRDAILDSRSLDKDGNFETPQPSSSPFSSTSGGNLSVAAAADAAATPSAPARPSTPSAASSAAAAAAAASAPATPPRRATFPTDQERATAAAAAMAAAISASVTTTTVGAGRISQALGCGVWWECVIDRLMSCFNDAEPLRTYDTLHRRTGASRRRRRAGTRGA